MVYSLILSLSPSLPPSLSPFISLSLPLSLLALYTLQWFIFIYGKDFSINFTIGYSLGIKFEYNLYSGGICVEVCVGGGPGGGGVDLIYRLEIKLLHHLK